MKNVTSKHHKESLNFLAHFPYKTYPKMRNAQKSVFTILSTDNPLLCEAPTGSGKTAIGYTYLKAETASGGQGYYVVPTKTLVDQIVQLHPDMTVVYGRNEYPCLYYDNECRADEIPCSLLKDCPHRVDLETGETKVPGVKPCAYLMAKYKARHARLVACTSSYYFFEALKAKELPSALVIDEIHMWADSIRNMLSYKITDYQLEQFAKVLVSVGCSEEARIIRKFKNAMIGVVKKYRSGRNTTLIEDNDLKLLLRILLNLKRANVEEKIQKAISKGKLDKKADREFLQELDRFSGDLYRYIKSLELSLTTEDRLPMTFVYGYWDRYLMEGKKVQYQLTIQSYAIAGLTKKKLLPKKYLALSATIGDPRMIQMETGVHAKFATLPSEFPIENTRIFSPTDVPDLSVKGMKSNDKNKMIRAILRTAKKASRSGVRSLVIVVSEAERQKIVSFSKEENVSVVTYGDGIRPKDAIKRFRDGEGIVLLGTEAQFGQGIDLPGGIAEFIFYLRPGYPLPTDPQAQFEELRYGNQRWALWTWRVIIKMLQARGRNNRSAKDRGCIFLMSMQFKRFTYGGLPEWLKPAYVGDKDLDGCYREAMKLIK